MYDNEKLVIYYRGDNIFTGELWELREYVTPEQLNLYVTNVRYSMMYNGIAIEVEWC